MTNLIDNTTTQVEGERLSLDDLSEAGVVRHTQGIATVKAPGEEQDRGQEIHSGSSSHSQI